jgi:type IV pilus assembly protein PilY1
MWEFTDADDPDLGNVIGKAQILKIRTSASTAAAVYKYYAVFASGVDNYVNDGHYSATGRPAIFLLDLSKAAGSAWVLGTNYYKIGGSQTSATDMFALQSTLESGMVGFTARLGDAGALTQIYAGDLQGNMWKLDFTKATGGPSGWKLSTLSYFLDSKGVPLPLYIAADGSGNRQPITMDPALIYGPDRGIIVAFGTGKFIETSDLTNTSPQSVYAVLDNNTTTADTTTPVSAIKGRMRLAPGTYTAGTGGGEISVPTFVWGRPMVDDDDPNADTTRSGWYFDYGTSGERQISDFTILPGLLSFGSVIPPATSCDNGSGNLYSVDVLTGDGTSVTSSVGIMGQPFLELIAVTPGVIGSTGSSSDTSTWQYIQQGAGGLTSPLTTPPVIPSLNHRLSWREVTNYQCVKNSTTGICQ